MTSTAIAPADPSLMIGGLSGAKYGVTFQDGSRDLLHLAITHLNTCQQHGGSHHFAITGEGATLWCSSTALACLNTANLGFTFFSEP